ncbi:MAG: WG repeat-containing protein [Bacteroidetes bacterium]|nr:WG repeat-containing protein [Bacteroidota bacterium]
MHSRISALLLLLTGALSSHGQSIVPVKKGNFWGFIDTSGKIIHNFVYTNPGTWSRNCYTAKKHNDLFFIYENGTTRFFENCDAAEFIDSNHFVIKRDGRYFFSDSLGKSYHNTGFERIQDLRYNPDRKSFLYNGKWGICNPEGQIINPARYYTIAGLCPRYYRAVVNKTVATLIKEAGTAPLLDSVSSVSVVDDRHFIFLCRGMNKMYFLIDGDGKVISKGKRIETALLKSEFMVVIHGKKSFLYDLRLKTELSNTIPPFKESALPNTVLTGNGYYNRYEGELSIPKTVKLSRINKYILCNQDGYFGLYDSSYNPVIQARYMRISYLGNDWFLIMDTTLSGALFHAGKRTFHSEFKYSSAFYDTQYIKAYDKFTGMDLYTLQNDTVQSVTPFENVVRIAVGKSDEESWTDAGETGESLPSFASRGSRRNFWYSRVLQVKNAGITVFGLGYRDSTTKKFIKLLFAGFSRVTVLRRPNLSIATYVSNPIAAPAIAGCPKYAFPFSYALVDDNTGKYIINAAGYIDQEELENNAGIVRAFSGNFMSLHDINSGRVLMRSTYISTETNGFRGVYTGGRFSINCGENGTQIISDKMNNSIGFVQMRNKGIENFGVQGGEWRASRNGALLNRIPENGKNRIQFLEPMRNGTAIYMLNTGKYGVMDSMGKCIIKPDYDYITRDFNTPDFFYCGLRSPSWGLISADGKILTPPVYGQIVPNGNHISASTNDNFLLDIFASDTVKLPLKSKVTGFENDAGFIKSKLGYHIYSPGGGIRYETRYQKVTPFHNGYAAVYNRKGWGVVDIEGNEIIPCKYKNGKTFGYTAAVLEKSRRFKFVFPGETALKSPLRADAVEEILPGYFVFKRGEKYAVYRANGKKMIGFRFSHPPALLGENIVGISGSTIFCIENGSGKARTFANDKRYKIKSFTEEQLPLVYTKNSSSRKSLQISPAHYFVYTGDSLAENLMVPVEYNDRTNTLQKSQLFEAWRNDIYMVRSGNLYRYLNGLGEEINNEVYRSAEPLKKGVAIVRDFNGKCGLMGKDMTYKIQPWFQQLKRVNDSVYAYSPGYKWDIYQPSGNAAPLIREAGYYQASPNGMVKMTKGNAMGYLRKDGRLVWDFRE